MLCRNCGAPLKSGMKFCQMCGEKTTQVCSACGAENDPSRSYCAVCGCAISAETDAMAGPTPTPSESAQPEHEQANAYSDGYGSGAFAQSGYTSGGSAQTGYATGGVNQGGYTQPQNGLYDDSSYAAPMGRMGAFGGLRSVLASKQMLIGTILLSASLLFVLFTGTSWLAGTDIYDTLYDVACMLDMEDLLDVLVGAGRMTAFATFFKNLLTQWPLVVIVIGLWLSYTAANDVSRSVMKDNGMAAIQTVASILSVLSYVSMAFWVLGCIVAAVGFSESWFLEDLVGICILALFIGGGVFALLAYFYKKIADMIKSLRFAACAGQTTCEVTEFVVVVIYILAGCKAIGALFSLGSFSAFVSGGCQVAALFVFAGCLKRCKNPTHT